MFFKKKEVYVFETHRGLWFEDGVFKKVLEPGRYEVPRHWNFRFYRTPKVEMTLVDFRERDLTIKGQEILTSDKVSIRVSIIVQYKVSDPKLASLEVENYSERLYSDVQLAARRSLANMALEEILTNKNNLSEDILNDVKEIALRYGVTVMRADVKDLIFPGDVQEIMNKVLKAERLSQAQMVEAKSHSEIQILNAKSDSEKQIIETEAKAKMHHIASEADAKSMKVKTEAEVSAMREKAKAEEEIVKNKKETAELLHKYPELLKIRETEALEALLKNTNARVFIGLDKSLIGKIETE